MTFPKSLATLGAILLLNPAATASPAPAPMPLHEAVRLALEGNPRLRAEAGRAEAAAGRAAQLSRWSNPELEFTAEEWPWRRGGGFSDAKQTVGISQTFPLPGKKALDRKMGAASAKAGFSSLEAARISLIKELTIAYSRTLIAGRVLELSKQLAAVADEAALAARKRVEAGAGAYQEQLRAGVQQEQARGALAEREAEYAAARRELAGWIGIPLPELAPLVDSLSETADPELLQAEETWEPRHPALAAAKAELERAETAARRAKLDSLPDPSIGVNVGRIGSSGESIIGLRLSVPLPLADNGAGRRREARAEVLVAAAEVRTMEQSLRLAQLAAAQRYRLAAQQITSYSERLLPQAVEALRLVRIGFEQGKFGLIDLLDTQRTMAEAQLAYLRKVEELNLAQAELAALRAGSSLPGGTGSQTKP